MKSKKIKIILLIILVAIFNFIIIPSIIVQLVPRIIFMNGLDYSSVVSEIYNGCYIEDLDDNMQSIYYYPTGNEKTHRKYIVEEWEDIIKYASNGKNIGAFHCIYNKFEEDEADKFVIFNTENEEKFLFDTQEEFLKFCEKEKIILSDWYTDGVCPYKKIKLGNGWCVYDYETNMDKIMNGYGVVYEGYVMKIEQTENGIAEFVFAVPYHGKYEIPTSNQCLEIGDAVVDKVRIPPSWFKEEVRYYEKLSLNTKTGEIKVIGE